jgi:hypothetical protein
LERVLRNTAATVSVTFYNGTTAVEADAAVTVVVKRADGSTLLSTTATNQPAVGVYSVVIPAQANLNYLTLTWTGSFTGTPVSITSEVEIVGGFYFSLGELRSYESAFANTTKYPDSALADARNQVESEFEDICHRAFVPRYWREDSVETDPDDDMLWMEKPEPNVFTVLKQNSVDLLGYYTSGYLIRDKNSPRGIRVINTALNLFNYNTLYYPISAEYEYGLKQVPIPIKNKALKRAKQNLLGLKSTIDERATTMLLPDIGQVNLATPGERGSETGVPDIDVVLRRYTLDGGAGVY